MIVNYGRELMFCLVAGLLFFQTAPGGANFAPVKVTSESVTAMNHESIRMDVQEVTIRLRRSDYVVEAVFKLFNTGETTTQWVGLHRYCDECSFISTFYDFKAEVDCQPVTFTVRNPLWMVGQVTFPGGSSTTIRIRYAARLSRDRNEGVYIVDNSRYWKGKIRKFSFTIDSSEICDTRQSDGGRALTKSLRRTESVNFKPRRFSNIFFRYE
jgi:hypothetical protein